MREKSKKITSIGGQALMEGILMRGPKITSIAVRQPDGTLDVTTQPTRSLKDRVPLFRLPLLRGIGAMYDSLSVGYKALMQSVEKSCPEEEEEPSKVDRWIEAHLGSKAYGIATVIGGVLGVALALVLFFILPTQLVNWLKLLTGEGIEPWRAVLEGVLRLSILIGYMALCSCQKDMRRVFQYHGAEHKTIFCYESGEELTVENVRRHTRFHPRCGTSFMVLMVLLGVIAGFFIPITQPVLRMLAKLLLLPLVVGIGYELIRLCGRCENLATRIIAAPGLWIQRLSTKEPDDGMIEAAIEAIRAVIPENGEDIVKG